MDNAHNDLLYVIVAVFGTAGFGWVAWVSLAVIRHGQKIKEASDLKDAVGRMEKSVIDEIKELEHRLDLFTKTEIQELKSIIQNRE